MHLKGYSARGLDHHRIDHGFLSGRFWTYLFFHRIKKVNGEKGYNFVQPVQHLYLNSLIVL